MVDCTHKLTCARQRLHHVLRLFYFYLALDRADQIIRVRLYYVIIHFTFIFQLLVESAPTKPSGDTMHNHSLSYSPLDSLTNRVRHC